jgi:hypothetical protein
MGSTPAQAQNHLAPVLITSEHALPHQPLRRGPDRRDTDRGAALALLARLLMEAAGVVATERDDDER